MSEKAKTIIRTIFLLSAVFLVYNLLLRAAIPGLIPLAITVAMVVMTYKLRGRIKADPTGRTKRLLVMAWLAIVLNLIAGIMQIAGTR